jgi:hypothetical protein
MACSMGRLVSWISMDRPMGDLEELKQCSPDLGDTHVNDCVGECDILQSYGEDSSPMGVIASQL